MKPEQSNPIALQVIRRVLAAAHPFEVTIRGTPVVVTVTGQEAREWPDEMVGVDEVKDGPWPPAVTVRCSWAGGAVDMQALGLQGRRGQPNGVISVRLPPITPLSFTNVSKQLLRSELAEIPVVMWIHLKKRGAGASQKVHNAKLKSLVSGSTLPMSSDWSVELFRIRMEDLAILPSAEIAFERLIHLNLFKLDFFSRGTKAKQRGAPLIDLAAMGLDDAAEREDESDEEERNYWAGGVSSSGELSRFIDARTWQMPMARDAEQSGAQQAWARFDEISVGDWFAIKEFGGEDKLAIRFLGEVTGIVSDDGRLTLAPLPSRTLHEGPTPAGSDASSWRELLVPIDREEIVSLVFGLSADDEVSAEWKGPKNVILFGPPGTGKTYRLRTDYRPKFVRRSTVGELDINAIAELKWYEVIAAALVDLGGDGTTAALAAHPFVKAKNQAASSRTPINSRLWGALQAHAVESSETVNYAHRSGRQIFDKRPDSSWFFPHGAPEDVSELAKALRPQPTELSEDFLFVTFHQSYAYEDFIEGIRPKTLEGDGESGPTLTYAREDGVFLRAANAAVRLAGFDGTVEEVCQLPREERTRLFVDAPPYGIFIDEINRGNVSRIFGELITLIEEDKRLGAEGEIIVTLPYSRQRFGVPPNLCLIGTMNTADRSVEALDAALRRRFAFVECRPDPAVLEGTVVEGGVDVSKMLTAINARLELLLDRDHTIGHAHFIGLKEERTIARLKQIFAMSILPLLSEYFYSDLGRIGLVLGDPFVKPASGRARLAPFHHEAADQLADRTTYRLTPVDSLSTADFKSIYETPQA